MKLLDTEDLSIRYRKRAINLDNKTVSITNLYNTEQEQDIKEKPNCEGFGRVRHFKYHRGDEWPVNPLPIMPAAKALGISPENEIRAQVFQTSVCNWRCWYCFSDFKLLVGSSKHSSFKTCYELLELYQKEPNRSKIIDLTGGQPDLIPEWIPWMMEALIEQEMDKKVFLWSDDNLSNDYFWKYLSDQQLNLIQNYKTYARVCCFKGIDKNSFSLNTMADSNLFENQFQLVRRLIELNIDLYFYVTLTAPVETNFMVSVPRFIDKLQTIHENLPLRVVPLEIFEFTPTMNRMNELNYQLIKGQYSAIKIWENELAKRYTQIARSKPITEVQIKL